MTNACAGLIIARCNKLVSRVIVRSSSLLSFASDRDPKEAEELPVHRYVSKKHKPVNMVYACGLNSTGALGVLSRTKKAKHLTSSSYPHRVHLGDLRISTADCGYGYTVLGTKSKDMIKVYGMGINTESQLGYHKSRRVTDGDDENLHYDFLMEPSPIGIPFEKFKNTKVVQVACGRAHTFVLTDKEGVFAFGNNSHGQCGRRIIEGELFQGSRKIHHISQSRWPSPVKQIACGMDHTLFLLEDGRVYSCGWGADGQTGLGHYNKMAVPQEVKGDLAGVKVVKVSTYADLSLAICDRGHIYGWGNSEYYQLRSVTDATQVHTPMRLPFDTVGKVTDAAAGGTICCLLNDKGQVWVWGYGILGKGPDLMDSKYPEHIPMTLFGQSHFNPDVRVTKVACGMNHFAAVTNKYELFTWGKNKYGCLGIASNRDQYFPWKVLLAVPVRDVFCGVDHTVIIARSIV